MNWLGFSSCCFPPTTPIEDVIDFCLDREFEALELEVNSTNFDPATVLPQTLERVGRLTQMRGLKVALHSPGGINLSDPNAARRHEAEEAVIQSLTIARQVGAMHGVVHPGRVVGEWSESALRTALAQNVEALGKCAAQAQELGVVLCVENLCHEPQSVNPDIRGLLAMCQQVGLDRIRITLDTNHAALVDGIAESVEVVGPYTTHVHFSSNKGVRSDHCTPQDGVIDFRPIATFLRQFDGLLVIELNEAGDQSAQAILNTRDYLTELDRPQESRRG